jgi:DNA-directed RNA polymerase subunit RPC12/RpoP
MSSSIAERKERHGIALRCPVCSHDTFHERDYAMRSPSASFFNHFWSLDETIAYACAQCGHILLFTKKAAAKSDTTLLVDTVTSRVL